MAEGVRITSNSNESYQTRKLPSGSLRRFDRGIRGRQKAVTYALNSLDYTRSGDPKLASAMDLMLPSFEVTIYRSIHHTHSGADYQLWQARHDHGPERGFVTISGDVMTIVALTGGGGEPTRVRFEWNEDRSRWKREGETPAEITNPMDVMHDD